MRGRCNKDIVFGSFTIRQTTLDDLVALRHFLVGGFGLPPDVECFSDEVLRWKYFDPFARRSGPCSYIAWTEGQIVGHIGILLRSFQIRGDVPATVPTLHFIDWLAARDHPSAGLRLMLQGFRSAPTQYAVGGSPDGEKMAQVVGYTCRAEFPTMTRVLRPSFRLRQHGTDRLRQMAQAVRDLGRCLTNPGRTPRLAVLLRPVKRFGSEVNAILAGGPSPLVFTSRSSELFNYYLQYPGGTMSGWMLEGHQGPLGVALLNVVREGKIRRGNIVECFLNAPDVDPWHAAIVALTQQLHAQHADIATCYASTPWILEACRHAGFRSSRALQKFYLRDRDRHLPEQAPFHLTHLEGDHAYLSESVG